MTLLPSSQPHRGNDLQALRTLIQTSNFAVEELHTAIEQLLEKKDSFMTMRGDPLKDHASYEAPLVYTALEDLHDALAMLMDKAEGSFTMPQLTNVNVRNVFSFCAQECTEEMRDALSTLVKIYTDPDHFVPKRAKPQNRVA